jgi:sugar phosphate permease
MERPTLIRWQATTIVLLIVGYAGYYLCRSNFSVALPLIIDELTANGMSASDARVHLGTIASIGVLAYAVGKFLSGALADRLGGRRTFLSGTAGAICFTALFAVGGGIPLFTLAWLLNRLVQSMGWPGAVKLASRWFSFSAYGTAMGFISLSYLFGDAAARQFMGWLLARGVGWRGIFFTAAGVMLAIFIAMLFLLKESPRDVGEAEPPDHPQNLIGSAAENEAPVALQSLLRALLRSQGFVLVCVLSLGCTMVRETFNTWTPTYFTQVVGLSNAEAAAKSALFPLVGGVSVLLAGFISDRLGRGGRAFIIVVGLLLSAASLLALANFDFRGSPSSSFWLVSTVAFSLIGPYSYLGGALALDFGGKKGSATASGIIDGVGYLGGVLAGDSIARISVAYGWQGAFNALGGVALITWLAALLFLVDQRRA